MSLLQGVKDIFSSQVWTSFTLIYPLVDTYKMSLIEISKHQTNSIKTIELIVSILPVIQTFYNEFLLK